MSIRDIPLVRWAVACAGLFLGSYVSARVHRMQVMGGSSHWLRKDSEGRT